MAITKEFGLDIDDRTQVLQAERNKLLELAEKLQDSYEMYELKSAWIVNATVALCGFLISLAAYAYFVVESEKVNKFTGFALALGLGVIYFISRRTVTISNRHGQRDIRACLRIVDMLRGIEPALSKERNLTEIERIGIRIRLSRFDVGPSQ